MSDYARDEILAEVISLANAQGGYVIIGVSESKEKPPRAEAILPLPRVGELGRRLEDQARGCIEPALTRFEVHPVETSNGEGVLVLYCAPSSRAPHRLKPSNEAFVRRGSSAVKMTMNEIQEMSVNMSRGLEKLPHVFAARKSSFFTWLLRDHCAAFRITSAPLRNIPDPGRLFGKIKQDLLFKRYRASIDGQKVEIKIPLTPSQSRPILRGARFYSEGSGGAVVVDQLQNGTVDIWFRNDFRDSSLRGTNEYVLYHSWVLGGVALALELVDGLRSLAGVPNCEYAMEVELTKFAPDDAPPLKYHGPLNSYGTDEYLLQSVPVLIGDFAVNDVQDFDGVVSRIDTDIYDAIGVRKNPRQIQVDWTGF